MNNTDKSYRDHPTFILCIKMSSSFIVCSRGDFKILRYTCHVLRYSLKIDRYYLKIYIIYKDINKAILILILVPILILILIVLILIIMHVKVECFNRINI